MKRNLCRYGQKCPEMGRKPGHPPSLPSFRTLMLLAYAIPHKISLLVRQFIGLFVHCPVSPLVCWWYFLCVTSSAQWPTTVKIFILYYASGFFCDFDHLLLEKINPFSPIQILLYCSLAKANIKLAKPIDFIPILSNLCCAARHAAWE